MEIDITVEKHLAPKHLCRGERLTTGPGGVYARKEVIEGIDRWKEVTVGRNGSFVPRRK